MYMYMYMYEEISCIYHGLRIRTLTNPSVCDVLFLAYITHTWNACIVYSVFSILEFMTLFLIAFLVKVVHSLKHYRAVIW